MAIVGCDRSRQNGSSDVMSVPLSSHRSRDSGRAAPLKSALQYDSTLWAQTFLPWSHQKKSAHGAVSGQFGIPLFEKSHRLYKKREGTGPKST